MKKLIKNRGGWLADLFGFASTTSIGAGIGGFFGNGIGRYLAPSFAEKAYHGVHSAVMTTTEEIGRNGQQETFLRSIVESFMGYAPSTNLAIQAPRIANSAGLSAYAGVSKMIENNCTVVGVLGTSVIVGSMYIAYRLGQSNKRSEAAEDSFDIPEMQESNGSIKLLTQ